MTTQRTVLVLAYYFPPMGASGVMRSVRLVKYLQREGWNVVVLAGTPKKYYAFDDSLLDDLSVDNIEIIRTASKNAGIMQDSGTSLPESKWKQNAEVFFRNLFFLSGASGRRSRLALRAVEQTLRERPINIVLATAPPFADFELAQKISARYFIPFVVDYRESWANNSSIVAPTPLHAVKNASMEEQILKKCSAAIVTSRLEKQKLLLRYRFLGHEDVAIVGNGYDGEHFESSSSNDGANSSDREKFVLTHCGVLHNKTILSSMMKAIKILAKKEPETLSALQLSLIGNIPVSFQKKITKEPFSSIIRHHGYKPHFEAVSAMKSADMLWLPVEGENIPGKLYEYIGARRPILATQPTQECNDVLSQFGAAEIVSSDKPQEWAATITRCVKLWKQNRLPKPDESFCALQDIRIVSSDISRLLSLHAKF